MELKEKFTKMCHNIGGKTLPKKYDEVVCKTDEGEISLMESTKGIEATFKGGEVAGRIDDVRDVDTRRTEGGEKVIVVNNKNTGVELGEEQSILRM